MNHEQSEPITSCPCCTVTLHKDGHVVHEKDCKLAGLADLFWKSVERNVRLEDDVDALKAKLAEKGRIAELSDAFHAGATFAASYDESDGPYAYRDAAEIAFAAFLAKNKPYKLENTD